MQGNADEETIGDENFQDVIEKEGLSKEDNRKIVLATTAAIFLSPILEKTKKTIKITITFINR